VQWIVNALYGGYTAANLLKWIWWRFNSYGYFWGMLAGIVAAGVAPYLSDAPAIYQFPAIFVISLAGSILGSLLTEPDDMGVLKNFYLKVRPWGFWRPVHDSVVAENPKVVANRDFRRDMANVAVGIVWQTALTATGVFLVLEDYRSLVWSVSLVAVGTLILKFNWYDKLQNYPADLQMEGTAK
jgi:uncharacterized membrane protein YeaQ/YmgE (transglycosylase-associated protein family)